MISGTVQDLLDAARAVDGKILNALEFPQEHVNLVSASKLSTDRLAWDATTVLHDKDSELYPIRDMSWGLGATAGAYTWWHIDSNGTLAKMEVKCGEKIWIFLFDEHGDFLRTCAFEDFQLDDPGKYRIEAILLRPGTRL